MLDPLPGRGEDEGPEYEPEPPPLALPVGV